MYRHFGFPRGRNVKKEQILVESLSKVDEAVVFYTNAFGAKVEVRLYTMSKPSSVSVDMKIGSLRLHISHRASGKDIEGEVLWLGTEDIKGAVEKAVKAGAVAVAGPLVKDPYGILWGFYFKKTGDMAREELLDKYGFFVGGGYWYPS